MRARRTEVAGALGALLLLGASVMEGDPKAASEARGCVEGVVRIAGVPSAARIELRPFAEDSPPVLGSRDLSWDDEDADPCQAGVLERAPVHGVAADERGRYRIEGLADGRYEIRAVAPSGARAFAGLRIEGGGARIRDLAITPGPLSLRGRIRWADGQPFRGTVVLGQPREGRRATPWLDGADAVETDPEGRFLAGGLTPGRVEVAAIVPGRVRVTWTRREATAGGEVEFVLDRGLAEASGRITTEDGDPVPDAPLVCRTVLDDGTVIAAATRTDPEGRYRVLAAPGTRRLHVRARGYVADTSSDEGSHGLACLGRAPMLRGTVRRKGDGTPVPGARVGVTLPSPQGWRDGWREKVVSADAEGRYELEAWAWGEAIVAVVGGRWVAEASGRASVRLTAGVPYVVDLEAIPGGGPAGSNVDVPRSDREPLLGRVLLPPGARPSAVWLQAAPAGRESPDDRPTSPPEFPSLKSLPVRSDGSFRIAPEHVGPYRVEAGLWHDGVALRGAVVAAPGTDDIVLALQRPPKPPKAWLLRVLGPDGAPVVDGDVEFYEVGPGYSALCGLRVEDGEVAFWSGRANTRLSAVLSEFRDAVGRPLPYALAETGDLAPGIHDLVLRPGHLIEGWIHGPNGAPVPYAEVAAYPILEAGEERSAHATGEADADGRFVLRHLELRDYEILVRPPPGWSPVPPTPVPMPVAEVDITVLPLVAVRVEVRSEEGRPEADARVVVWSPTGEGALATGAIDLRTGTDGAVTLPPLPPMEGFDLRVEPAGLTLLPTLRRAWRPVPTVLELPRADVLRGVVRDTAGRPLHDATVWLRGIEGEKGGPLDGSRWHRIRDGWVLGATCSSKGEFCIGRLVPGRVEIFAASVEPNGAVHESPPSRVSTAASEVVLTIAVR